MKKRRLAIVLAAALLASLLGGCASVFDKEYLSVSDFVGVTDAPDELTTENGVTSVKDLFALKLAITQLVSAHEDSGVLDLRRYNGEIADDVAAACKEVSTNTALGSYCVEYITYDLDRIVAYYEATVYITYSRTAEEVDAIRRVSTVADAERAVREALSAMKSTVTLMTSSGSTDTEDVEGFVTAALHADPLSSVCSPAIKITPYVGGSQQRIFEISFDYGLTAAEAQTRMTQLAAAADTLAAGLTAKGEAYLLLAAARALLNVCDADDEGGRSAWDALVGGRANSEGVALGYAALCEKLALGCRVVSGMMDNADHCWNIVRVGEDRYHVDLSRADEAGLGATFLLSDSAMGSRYLWDADAYPECSGYLTFADLTPDPDAEPSAEPSAEPTEAPPTEPTASPEQIPQNS